MRGQEKERVYRIGLIQSIIKQCNSRGVGANKNKLIAQFMVDYGVARRTMLEYLQALILSERIKLEGEDLWTNKNAEIAEEDLILNAKTEAQ